MKLYICSILDLFHNDFDLEESASCSKYIFAQKNFTEWPEFAELCENLDTNYLQNCSGTMIYLNASTCKMKGIKFVSFAVPPFFTSDGADQTNKLYKEFDVNENITCSAVGYPPPELSWDDATGQHLINAEGRLEVSTSVQKIFDGNWTMQSTIIFTEVYMMIENIFA